MRHAAVPLWVELVVGSLGTLCLVLGLGCEWSNWLMSRRGDPARRPSPVVLVPPLLNWGGACALLWAGGVLRPALALSLAALLTLLHLVCLLGRRTGGRG